MPACCELAALGCFAFRVEDSARCEVVPEVTDLDERDGAGEVVDWVAVDFVADALVAKDDSSQRVCRADVGHFGGCSTGSSVGKVLQIQRVFATPSLSSQCSEPRDRRSWIGGSGRVAFESSRASFREC